MWKEIEQFEPLTAKAVKELGASSTCDLDFLRLAPEPFARAQRVYRLCGHGTHQECGSHSSGFRLVGYRQLEQDVLDHDAAGNAIQEPSNGPRWRQPEVPDLGFAAFDPSSATSYPWPENKFPRPMALRHASHSIQAVMGGTNNARSLPHFQQFKTF